MRPLRHRWLGGVLLALLLPATVSGGPAEDLYRNGLRAQRQGRHIEAYLLLNRARALDPANLQYASAARRVRRGAAQLLAAAGEHRVALEVAPDTWEFQSIDAADRAPPARATITTSRQEGQPAGPKRLRFGDHAASFRFRGTLREAYLRAATEFGIRVVFHDEFDGESAIRADLTECDFRCAMRVLGEIGRTLVIPLDEDLIFVAVDSAGNRAELEPAALASVPLDGAMTPEEVSEISQAVQQVLDIRRLGTHPAGGLVLRDSVAKVGMARRLVEDLLHPRAMVQIDVRLVSVSASRNLNGGVTLPTTFPLTNLSTLLGAVPSSVDGDRLVGLGGGKTVLGLAVGDASLAAQLDAGWGRTIHSLQLRSAHGMPAEFKIGERYPIATAQFSGGTGASPDGAAYVQPPPSISFEDLGLNLSMTPLVHNALDVTLELDVNFRLLAGLAVNDIPVLSNREFRSRVRLRRGEFAIVSGMTVYERRAGASGLAGLGRIPWLGGLFRTSRRSWSRNDLLILMQPRIVRLPPGELGRAPTFVFGTAERALPAL